MRHPPVSATGARLFAASCVVYVASFFGPGFVMFVATPFLVFDEQCVAPVRFAGAWLANPVYWFGAISWWARRPRRALVAGVVATILGLLALPDVRDHGSRTLLVSHAPWVVSFVLLAAAAAVCQRHDRADVPESREGAPR